MAVTVQLASRTQRFLDRARWGWAQPEVYALVGKAGTGKSFRAALLAHRYAIEHIVDDGLLIRGGKIIAGQSAKRESSFLAATRTACFLNPEHRMEVRDALREHKVQRILLLGTSDHMLRNNCIALGLPMPKKTVRIEDIATREEIATAILDRSQHGRHVIPLPAIEVRGSYPKIFAESFNVWLHRGWSWMGRGKRQAVEKTIVRPEYSHKGSVSIGEAALSQMVLHCVAEIAPEISVAKIRIRQRKEGCELRVILTVPLGHKLPMTLYQLREMMLAEIEGYTGIWISRLDLSVESLKDGVL
ncbi:MAG: hypothetical protein JJU20_14285 [Opitutales bacterium]|nr:hypothetical protein [Opitutales bacterium]